MVQKSEVTNQQLMDKMNEIQKDMGAQLDATKELTKIVSELVAAWEKWRKAGKF